MNFEDAHTHFLAHHCKLRQGESLRRLQMGHSHAERLFLHNVWWPAVGDFDHLFPEYEVTDYRDGSRFLDFAYIRKPHRIAIEIDGYGAHETRISRSKFADDRHRQNHLMLDGWKVIRFAYDDVQDQPRTCMQTVHQFLGRWYGGRNLDQVVLTCEEKAIMRLAMRCLDWLKPGDIVALLDVCPRTAQRLLLGLAGKGMLQPVQPGLKKNFRYRISQHLTIEQFFD